tara:strand:+ start:532 stop:1446 length:915 start_codon:yes stop_codon:yes gene_type:complete
MNKNVEQQFALAEDMHRKIYEGNTSEDAPKENDAPEVKEVPENTQEVIEQKSETTEIQKENIEENKVVNWEHKFKVIDGKYRAEVPLLAGQIRELKAQIDTIKNTPEKEVEKVESNVKPEEVEEYGENYVDFVKRSAMDVVGDSKNKINELEKTVSDLQQQQQTSSRQKFLSELEQLCPTYQDLNSSDGFISWLREVDPFTGLDRKTIFEDADVKNDSMRIANMFNAYLQQHVKQEPSSQPVPLAEQVTPKTTKRTPVPQGKKLWTKREIIQFYDNSRRGKYSPEKLLELEKDIFQAQSEGRVR